MKPMKIFDIAAVVVCILSSCDPQAFTMNVEMRHPSKSGMDLTGKTIAVVYIESGSGRDSVYNEYLANGFASSIENDYFGGEEAVSLYKVKENSGADWSSVDSLAALVMQTGDDIVFLFDEPDFGNLSVSEKSGASGKEFYAASVPVNVRLYAFDSMGKTDTVYRWQGKRTISQSFYADSVNSRADVQNVFWDAISVQSGQIGRLSARLFSPSWKVEAYTLLYYDTESWNRASEAACQYKWKEAIELWIKLLDTNSELRRSCAEYNIATACYMLGDNELALKWLDRSDADYPISLSSGLRKRIRSRM